MSKFEFNGDINGDGHHFGDVYKSADAFTASHNKFGSDERRIIELIFQLEDPQNKKVLLQDLSLVHEGKEGDLDEANAGYWKKFAEKLADNGIDKGVKMLTNLVTSQMVVFAPAVLDVFA